MKTFQFDSTSTQGQKHTVTLSDQGTLRCSCRGFSSPNRCWHVKDVANNEGLIINDQLFRDTVIQGPKQESFLEVMKGIPIEPMLARGLKEEETINNFDSSLYVMEEKYNGHRMIIEVGQDIMAWSRAGNMRLLPRHISRELRYLPYGLYDSELYIPGGQSTDVTAIHLQDKLELAVFDVMQLDKTSTTDKPLYERRMLLEEAFRVREKSIPGTVYKSIQFDPNEKLLQKIWDHGGEGAILKLLTAPYDTGKRSKSWIKFKKEISQVVKIIRFMEGLLGPHSKVVGIDEQGVEVRVKMLNDMWRAKLDIEGGAKYIGAFLRFNHQGKTRDKKKYTHPMMDHIYFEE